MSLLIKYLLKTSNKQPINSHQINGFTMVELLVATVMSFLIITPILAFAVNILNDDVREQAKASTELELQSAMDYIQQDISQAFYIYDGAGVNTIKGQLYDIPNVTDETPVLVFWKRELVKDAIDVTEEPNTVCSDAEDKDGKCDDTYVESLVAYYLVREPGPTSKWCQPGSGNCPARIERWSIKDGVKRSNGTYLCGETGEDTGVCPDGYKAQFRKDKGFNSYSYKAPDATGDPPLTWKNSGYDNTTPVSQVLVNYISNANTLPTPIPSAQCSNVLNVTTPVENNLRIGVTDYTTPTTFTSFYGCVNTAGNIAQITIRGDALRRNDANSTSCNKESPNCPSVTGQIGGRSRFGQ